MDNQVVLTAFLLTLLAGLSTGIGSLISLIAKHTNTNFLSFSLGLSAGVMIYVSFMEMLPKSLDMLSDALIDFLVPKSSNPHEMHSVEEMKNNKLRLKHTGIITALTIGIHNFPEGIATFMTALNSFEIAIPITVAIAIHNIPEGIAVAVPIYHATGNRKKAFWLSFLSGLAEPVGAIIAYLFLIRFWNPVLDALILAIISGVMIFISLDELLPSAEKYGKHHLSIIGLITGMVIMAISLYLFI